MTYLNVQGIAHPIRAYLLFVLLTIPVVTHAEGVSDKQFVVYNGLAGSNLPQIDTVKFPVMPIGYEQYFYLPDQERSLPPENSSSIKYLEWLHESDGFNDILVLDMEAWASHLDATTANAHYIAFAQSVKDAYPAMRIGYYGLLPQREYWAAQHAASANENNASTDEWAKVLDWRSLNDSRTEIVDKVDMLFPSLYTFYNDPVHWQSYAIENLKEARRIGQGKPVIPFIWPLYHTSNAELGGQPIDVDFWLLQLNTLLEHADGVVIWGYFPAQNELKADEPWLRATLEFIDGLKVQPAD